MTGAGKVVDKGAVQALETAVARSGGQAAMARLLGVSQPAVWRWLHGKSPLPPKHIPKVEEFTGVSRYDLAPEVYGPAPALGGTIVPSGFEPVR